MPVVAVPQYILRGRSFRMANIRSSPVTSSSRRQISLKCSFAFISGCTQNTRISLLSPLLHPYNCYLHGSFCVLFPILTISSSILQGTVWEKSIKPTIALYISPSSCLGSSHNQGVRSLPSISTLCFQHEQLCSCIHNF